MSPVFGAIAITIIIAASFVAQRRVYTSKRKYIAAQFIRMATSIATMLVGVSVARDISKTATNIALIIFFGAVIGGISVLPYALQHRRISKM